MKNGIELIRTLKQRPPVDGNVLPIVLVQKVMTKSRREIMPNGLHKRIIQKNIIYILNRSFKTRKPL